MTQEASP